MKARLTLYSKAGCHLCDEMKEVVDRLGSRVPLELHVVDISTDPVLEKQFGAEIPVLMIEGRKAAKFRVTEEELEKVLAGRTAKGRT